MLFVPAISVISASLKDSAEASDNMEPVLYLRVAKIIIGLFGMIGNSLVCLVIHRNREMHTLTNGLIFNQAVIDFMSCLFIFLHSNIPNVQTVSAGVGGHLFCQLWNTPIALFALLVASTFNLVVITLERYVAIIFPFIYIKLFNRRKNIILICCIWVCALTYKLVDMTRYDVRNNQCITRDISWQKALGIIQFSVQYFLPISVMLFAYGHIIITLSNNPLNRTTRLPKSRNSTSNTSANSSSTTTNHESLHDGLKRARRNTVKTLLLVAVAFGICWTPNQFMFLFYNLGFGIVYGTTGYRITVILAQSNSAINFLVYGFKYRQFRRGLRRLFGCSVSVDVESTVQGTALNESTNIRNHDEHDVRNHGEHEHEQTERWEGALIS